MNDETRSTTAETTKNTEVNPKEAVSSAFTDPEQAMQKKPPKPELDRLRNHVDTLLKEKKAHLRKIATLEETIDKLQKENSSPQIADIFSTAQDNAEKYYLELKSLADSELENAKVKAKKILEETALEVEKTKSAASRELSDSHKRGKLMISDAIAEKTEVEAEINKLKEESKVIIVKAKEEAEKILSDANYKLNLADQKYTQAQQRAEEQAAKIISCARFEYDQLRELISKTTGQYTSLCKELANFTHITSFTESGSDML